jgi:outer membrane murein-binding lipoprotein Lpp
MLAGCQDENRMISIKVTGLDEKIKALEGLANELDDTIQAAGEESAKAILAIEGLQKYPPETEANLPSTPYYIRGRGTQRGGVRVPEYNDFSSQRLGTHWVVERIGRFITRISNATDYAPFAHGENQSWFMAEKGWRKLGDVGQEKAGEIQRIYEAWIDRLIRKVGLK